MISTQHDKLLANKYGYFSPDGREFVITDVLTPRPWINVMSNGRYGLVLSQVGGGFSWIDNCQLQRLTRWDQDLSCDQQGRFIYLWDKDRPESPWSTTFQPTRKRAEEETVRHGCGYTVFERLVNGIETEQTVFVPSDANCEFWLVKVTNTRTQVAHLGLATYLDWHLGGQGDWHREFHRLFVESEPESNLLLAWKHGGFHEGSRERVEIPFVAYHGLVGLRVEAWQRDKEAFLGPVGSTANPILGSETSGTGRWDDPIASASASVTLAPSQSIEFVVVLGAEDSVESARAVFAGLTVDCAKNSFEQVLMDWDRVLGHTEVQTPEPSFNVLNNVWLKYQTIAGRLNARCAYYQQGGAFGYRDQLQDSLLHLTMEPSKTLDQLKTHAEAMYEDGGVRHWWHPGFDIHADSHHSDTCLWLAYGLLAHIDETNDLSSLDTDCAYLSRETGKFSSRDSLFDHAMRGIDRALDRLSPRGLPLIAAGDWNDGLSHAGISGKGESIWLAMFLFDILNRWQGILCDIGESSRATRFERAADMLQHAVEKYAWEDDRYVAGFNDEGRPFGSRSESSPRIFLNTQTWATISRIAPPDRARRALDSVEKYLLRPYGALLLTPAYNQPDPMIGYITRYAPGLRENGGVYSHASTWAVQAFSMAGKRQLAYEIFESMSPPIRAQDADRYASEPYVMPGNVDGPESPHEGRAGWTWYTGSSAWMHRVALDWILGIRASRKGLLIDPYLPDEWPGFSARREFRGDTYRIHATRSTKGQRTVDGREFTGVLEGTGTGKNYEVSVELP